MVRGTALVAIALVGAIVTAAPAYAQQKKAAFNVGGISVAPPQPTTDSGVGVGALGGLTFTSASGDDSEGIATGTGWMIGIWFGGNINGPVGFMGELSYVRKRLQDEFDGDNNYLETDYLEIPALVRINIGSRAREGVRGYGLIGPVFDIRLGSKLVDSGFEIPETELENQFSAVDIGLMAGAGIEWNRIGFEFRYSWGLTRLATDEAVDAGFLPDVKNNTIQLVGKIRFN
jgi:hypothetical protein